MKIYATVVYPVPVEIECDEHISIGRLRDLIFADADKHPLAQNEPQIMECLKINELCPEENEEISEALG